jgi:uncharacterized membrane protein YgdD (TMEM256/DUF423 family)
LDRLFFGVGGVAFLAGWAYLAWAALRGSPAL